MDPLQQATNLLQPVPGTAVYSCTLTDRVAELPAHHLNSRDTIFNSYYAFNPL